ncbi:MAG: TetR/AcrR family transcriptional regulator [Vicinamibacterales bacterium]
MGIKQRQERDREAVRRAILDAARELFMSEGYGNVSIRKIAERVEYSPAALYSYFPSKDDIFFALAEDGFQLLHDAPSRGAVDACLPLERIRATFARLYQFSLDHPEHFSLMFVDRTVPRIGQEYERFTLARQMKAQLVSQVQQCIDAGLFPHGTPALVASRLLAASLVGVALMRLSDRLAPGENGEDLALDVVDVVIAGLQSGIRLRSHSLTDPCPLEAPRAATGLHPSEEPHP